MMGLTLEEILQFGSYRNIALSSFFVAFGIIFFVLFFAYKIKRENLFFSLFCFSISILFLSLNLNVNRTIIILDLIFSLELISLLLAKILLEKNKILLPLFVIGIMLIFAPFFLEKNDGDINLISWLLIVPLFLYSVIGCFYTAYKGYSRKKENTIAIVWTSIGSISLFIVSFITKSHVLELFFLGLGAIIFPLTLLILLGKRILDNHNILKHQLIEVENEQLIKIENLAIENLKKEKEKQQILENQNKILEENVIARTLELVNEKQIVEEKNREILDSIFYAKRIQATILPPLVKVKEHFKDSFVLYLPKDIVAGDFYWMEVLEDSDTIFFAVCDCTGHGVPGAFVSVICSNALNKTVREFGIRNPSEILDKVSEIVSFDLSLNNEDDDEIMDGMDISFCALNVKTNFLQWSGANNPFWLIKKSGELIEIKADKQPIGKSHNSKKFTNHEMQLEIGDAFYLLSDGYADQFGGIDEIKFQRSKLKQLLIENHHQPLNEQGNVLLKTILDWKGNSEQTDDICVVGIRI
jgi:serine phosphatase RsbU (regulator of sigma subunit)